MGLRYAIVAGMWTLWCLQHSLLNSRGFLNRVSAPGSRLGRYYRLIYNLFSVATLALVVSFTPRGGEEWLWRWDGWLRPLQILIVAAAVFLFWLSFRLHDSWAFLGLPQRADGKPDTDDEPLFFDHGVYGVIRHPQYTAGLMVLWARDIAPTELVINIVLSVYLVVGARIEESRLLSAAGDEYARYRSRVPAFIPNHMPRLSTLLRPRE